MRIIAGEWRGRRLEVPKGIRPMLDRERERLFGILGPALEDAVFLDLFSGSGAASLEALSRGAREAIAVENGRRVLPVLQRNATALGAGERLKIIPVSAFSLHHSPEPKAGAADVALCTPPFPLLADPRLRSRFRALFEHVLGGLMAPGGRFVLEHPRHLDPASVGVPGKVEQTRATAASAISFWTAEIAP